MRDVEDLEIKQEILTEREIRECIKKLKIEDED
jgi:hypothetical protein